jgi:hypothetical protein
MQFREYLYKKGIFSTGRILWSVLKTKKRPLGELSVEGAYVLVED